MKPQALRDLLHSSPFHPFRLHLVDGKTLAVPHQDFALVTLDYAVVATVLPGERPGGVNLVPYEHVARIEMLPRRARKTV